MSRIDQLLSIVENLERKTDCILSNFQTTNELSNKIDHLNDQLSTFDIRINDTNNLIIKKFEFLNGYNDLLLRTNMFELNVHNNDPLTNQHILLNLDHEYQQLKAKYGVEPSFKAESIPMIPPQEFKSPMKSRSQKLRASLSISNLSLKPMKCKPNKIYKKKSHYKISNVFDKPVVSPIVEQGSFDDSIHENSKESDFSIDFADMIDRDKSISPTVVGVQSQDQIQDQIQDQSQDSSQPHLDNDFNTESIQYKLDSKSSLSQQNLLNLQTHHLQTQNLQSLHSIETNLSHSDSSLLDRLDSDTPDTFTSENAIDEIFDINSEPMIKSTNYDVFDDNESTISNESNFENFENYLRKSRINLNSSSYPYILKTTTSESSINFKTDLFDGVVINNDSFSSDESKLPYTDPSSPTPRRLRSPEIDIDRFHNPIDNLKIANESVTPTIEQIYSTFNSEGDTKTLLNKVMNNTPSKPFSFLNLLNDKDNKDPKNPKEPIERRKSVGSSLNNFLSLMTSESPKQIQGITKSNLDTGKKDPPTPGQRRRKRINKLDELKNVPKTNPITVMNELQIKRLPPSLTCLSPKSLSTRTLSSSSKVIIDSNKSFFIHGDKSIFNTPVLSNFSNRSLQDALHSSLSY
ncbi:hypothetical protein CLIB1444_12S01354 [[Candida] jaroonii]|uniref:Uncharacterized protein n=1 Tax=[Candida] jaroonii TaxID=467808 RepID=A0ACA9YDZ7_9ASCO|nr:hypothetical protein CLIB1444_12S01354 [[Candida] jaroonii]